MVIGAQNGREASGTEIVLTTPKKLPSQRFTLENAGGGYFYLRGSKGLYLHTHAVTYKEKSLVHYWSGKGRDNTKWKFVPAGGDKFLIQSKTGSWLDAQWAKGSAGTPIWMWTRHGRANQQWKLIPTSTTQAIGNGNKIAQIKPVILSTNATTATTTTPQQKTLVVKLTGIRLEQHDGDCKRIHGSLAIQLANDLNCKNYQKPSSGKAAFHELRDFNTSWQRQWTTKKVAQVDRANSREPSPNNHSFTQVYKVNVADLSNNAGLRIYGYFQQCHKSGWSAGDYNCSIFYHFDQDHRLDFKKAKQSFTISPCSMNGCTHTMRIYIETSIL